jgi:Domain of unknown function (DUF4189)
MRQEQYYGAIAYSQSTGTWGYSRGYQTRTAAERTALAYCPAPDAAVVMWGTNLCIALAVGEGGAWGAAGNEDQLTAEREALRFCRQYAQSCRIAVVVETRPYPQPAADRGYWSRQVPVPPGATPVQRTASQNQALNTIGPTAVNANSNRYGNTH